LGGFKALGGFDRGAEFGEEARAFGRVAEAHADRVDAFVADEAHAGEAEAVFERGDFGGVGGAPIAELKALVAGVGDAGDLAGEGEAGKQGLDADREFEFRSRHGSDYLPPGGCYTIAP
jgi:hypothetical protein